MALLPDDDVARRLSRVGWERDGDSIVKTVKKKDFAEALAFVNAVGERAEAANHHPDVAIRWNTVTLRLSTHSEGGLTEKDFALAAEIDALSDPGT
jgi:4a-hydroxytetrahydrobiopterin dehydratase